MLHPSLYAAVKFFSTICQSCSNGRDGESWESKCATFSPSCFPFTLIRLRFLLYGCFLWGLQALSRCWYHTMQTQPVPLRIPHGTLNTQHIPSPRHRPYSINCPDTPE